VEINFKTRKLTKVFNSNRELTREYGPSMAKIIQLRLAVLRSAPSLDYVPHQPPERRHELTHNRSGQYSVDLKQPYRLVFEPNHDPLPFREDGGMDIDRITSITILEIIDYHPRQ